MGRISGELPLVDPDIANEHDPNERFVARKCALYLDRLLSGYCMINAELMGLLHWIVGGWPEDVESLIEAYTGKAKKRKLQQSEANAIYHTQRKPSFRSWVNMDTHATFIHSVFHKLATAQKSHFTTTLQGVLRRRALELHSRSRCDIERSMARFGKLFNLSNQELEFCLFCYINASWKAPEALFSRELLCFTLRGRSFLGLVLGIRREKVNNVYRTLARMGMVSDSDRSYMNGDILNLYELRDEILELFHNPESSELTRRLFAPIPRKTLPLDYHQVHKNQIDFVLSVLQEKPAGSTHVLVYGPPGTGKSSFAHGIARKLGVRACQVTRGDESNSSVKRRASVVACLNMMRLGKGSLVIVDEADNLLNTSQSWFRRGETQDKGWLNYILEEPGVRMIWITNTIDEVEPSVLRRFAYSIHFRPFSRKQRLRLWSLVLGVHKARRLLSSEQIGGLSRKFVLNAGAIDLAVRSALESGHKTKETFLGAVTLALEAHQELQGEGIDRGDKEFVRGGHDLEGLNVDQDLNVTIARLEATDRYLRENPEKRRGNAKLLLYGPPGTGKTEFAYYLAHRLEREPICKRASDLLDPYVGITERKIRDAFLEAEAQEAVLIIDEVDSMVFSRDRAQRSWEVSFTNEFLARMEQYRGILVCTTNRLGDLDHATLRRFQYKLEFKYLTAKGNLTFYHKLLAPLLTFPLGQETKRAISALPHLAPGDFSVVRDRFVCCPSEEINHRLLLDALNEEARLKQAHLGEKKIGF